LCAGVAGATTPTVLEFSICVTVITGPDGISAGPDGNLWFTEYDERSRVRRVRARAHLKLTRTLTVQPDKAAKTR
jgi:streptogramin lyase